MSLRPPTLRSQGDDREPVTSEDSEERSRVAGGDPGELHVLEDQGWGMDQCLQMRLLVKVR